MSKEKLATLLQIGRLNQISKSRKLTDIEKLEHKALLATMPKQ